MDKNKMIEEFEKKYGYTKNVRTFFAPGRVNLIGEHIDYNGGYVFPCALDIGTYAVAAKRNDDKIRFSSLNMSLDVEINVQNITYDEKDDWANYPKGVIKTFLDRGFISGGFDILFYGNIPNGAGLSSSASIELVTSVVLKGLFDFDIDMVEMVKISQYAENNFVGLNCGIMDQFVIGMGKKEHAVLLDCNTLDYKYVPLKMDSYKLIITNSKKRRGLADSKYNERRSECERALADIKKKLDIKYLCDMSSEEFEENKNIIANEIDRKRAKHAVYENIRTKKALESLNLGDIKAFGKLMTESHNSLKNDYEVTGVELDTLVEESLKINGVIGSRMTGAGFGGCTVTIIKENMIETFKEEVGKNYKEKIGLEAEFYVVEVGDGAREL